MDDTVARREVRGLDRGVTDEQPPAEGAEFDRGARKGLDSVESDEVGGGESPGHDVMLQDAGEGRLGGGFEQAGDRVVAESSEGVVGGGEDGEGAGAREGTAEIGGTDRGEEGLEAARRGRKLRNRGRGGLVGEGGGAGDGGEREGENREETGRTHGMNSAGAAAACDDRSEGFGRSGRSVSESAVVNRRLAGPRRPRDRPPG